MQKYISLQLAERLQQAGVNLETEHYWFWYENGKPFRLHKSALEAFATDGPNRPLIHAKVPAPDLPELLDKLPYKLELDTKRPEWFLEMQKEKTYCFLYAHYSYDGRSEGMPGTSHAEAVEAAGLLLLELAKQGLLTT